MPRTRSALNQVDWTNGGLDVRRTETGTRVTTICVARNDAGDAEQLNLPFDMTSLTAGERTSFNTIMRKIVRLQTLAILNAADATEVFEPDLAQGRQKWIFTEI